MNQLQAILRDLGLERRTRDVGLAEAFAAMHAEDAKQAETAAEP